MSQVSLRILPIFSFIIDQNQCFQLQKHQNYHWAEQQFYLLMLKAVIAVLITCLLVQAQQPYCSSTCIDYVGACFDETPHGCWVCANHIFNMNSIWGSPHTYSSCAVLTQTSVLASELPNDPAMSLFGYTSSNPTPLTCSNYTFSGQYISSDYIYKNFTGIPLNHYALVVRFNVGYMGELWQQTDVLRLTLQDEAQTVNYDYNYSCQAQSQNICGQTWNTSDCIRIREYTLTHNTSFLFLNFTALTSETNATVQSWGIKELIVAAKECHSYCQTCYGGSNANCLSCATGFYLQGNVCMPICDAHLYTIADQRLCSSVCPSGYFPLAASSSSTGVKSCNRCADGCMICSSFDSCQAWQGQNAYTPDIWKDKMQFWILLIIVVLVVIVIIVYKIVKASMKPSDLQQKLHTNGSNDEKGSNQQKKSNKSSKSKSKKSDSDQGEKKHEHGINAESKMHLDSDANIADNIILPDSKLWFNELVELEPTEVKVTRPRRRRKSPPGSKEGSITEGVEMGTNAEL